MKTKEELNSAEFNDDLQPLVKLLKVKKANFTFKRHRGADPKLKELIGFYPTGEWQIVINDTYSVIRGMASFGNYEIMNIGKGEKFAEPERFETPEELLEALLVG